MRLPRHGGRLQPFVRRTSAACCRRAARSGVTEAHGLSLVAKLPAPPAGALAACFSAEALVSLDVLLQQGSLAGVKRTVSLGAGRLDRELLDVFPATDFRAHQAQRVEHLARIFDINGDAPIFCKVAMTPYAFCFLRWLSFCSVADGLLPNPRSNGLCMPASCNAGASGRGFQRPLPDPAPARRIQLQKSMCRWRALTCSIGTLCVISVGLDGPWQMA